MPWVTTSENRINTTLNLNLQSLDYYKNTIFFFPYTFLAVIAASNLSHFGPELSERKSLFLISQHLLLNEIPRALRVS